MISELTIDYLKYFKLFYKVIKQFMAVKYTLCFQDNVDGLYGEVASFALCVYSAKDERIGFDKLEFIRNGKLK